jgi:hypothetical protein
MWQRIKVGAPAALILAGLPLLIGSQLAGPVLIGAGLLLGLAFWLAGRLPIEVRRTGHAETQAERRELLSLARAVAIELETCRLRLVRADEKHIGWFAHQTCRPRRSTLVGPLRR